MLRFRNKKTGKTMSLNEGHDSNLIANLRESKDWQELVTT